MQNYYNYQIFSYLIGSMIHFTCLIEIYRWGSRLHDPPRGYFLYHAKSSDVGIPLLRLTRTFYALQNTGCKEVSNPEYLNIISESATEGLSPTTHGHLTWIVKCIPKYLSGKFSIYAVIRQFIYSYIWRPSWLMQSDYAKRWKIDLLIYCALLKLSIFLMKIDPTELNVAWLHLKLISQIWSSPLRWRTRRLLDV